MEQKFHASLIMCEIYTQHQSWPLIGRANMKCIDILFSHVLLAAIA